MFSVFKEDPDPNLDGVSFDKSCTVDDDLTRGSGTVLMLKAAIKALYILYPGTQNIRLKDTSFVTCEDNVHMKLALMHIVKRRRTWYQDKFGAICERKSFNRELTRLNDKLDAVMSSSFKEFYRNHIMRSGVNFDNHGYDTLKADYTSHMQRGQTYRDFLNYIMSEYDCSIMNEWFVGLMHDFGCPTVADEEFVIRRGVVESWTDVDVRVTESKNTQRGGATKRQSLTRAIPRRKSHA
jgi:hypothetical protein